MKPLNVDVTKLITPSAYARKYGESPQLVRYWMMTGKLVVIKIEGGNLIYLG